MVSAVFPAPPTLTQSIVTAEADSASKKSKSAHAPMSKRDSRTNFVIIIFRSFPRAQLGSGQKRAQVSLNL